MGREALARLAASIGERMAGRPRMQLMEVCGTHTVAFFRSGVTSLLPPNLGLVSGPGCPVCVTSQGYLDAACDLARCDGVTVCTYGDMVRVPGSTGSLEALRASGADVVVVYSPRDALALARRSPARQVVFLAVGFETTTPGTAATLLEAQAGGVDNFTVLAAHKLVIPALQALLSGGVAAVDGFILPGHVCVILGTRAFQPVAEGSGVPCVVTGFEPGQLLRGVDRLVELVAEGRAFVDNVYTAAVPADGNPAARAMVDRVFQPGDAVWRAMGTIPGSGLDLKPAFRRFDARERFGVEFGPDVEPPGCRCGLVIQGAATPADCPLFGRGCTPAEPVGPCMVSSEGTCAAWYKYGGGRPAPRK